MKYASVLPIALVAILLSLVGDVRAFDSFYQLVGDEIHAEAPSQHGAVQHGAVQHGALKHDAVQHGAVQHGAVQHGTKAPCRVEQKCDAVQKCCPTQKCQPAQKCGLWNGISWGPTVSLAQKGCVSTKGHCKQKPTPLFVQKGCDDAKGGCHTKGLYTPGLCHLQACAVRLECAALNLHSHVKVHCEILKERLCAPLCGCGSKGCGGKCSSAHAIPYGQKTHYLK